MRWSIVCLLALAVAVAAQGSASASASGSDSGSASASVSASASASASVDVALTPEAQRKAILAEREAIAAKRKEFVNKLLSEKQKTAEIRNQALTVVAKGEVEEAAERTKIAEAAAKKKQEDDKLLDMERQTTDNTYKKRIEEAKSAAPAVSAKLTQLALEAKERELALLKVIGDLNNEQHQAFERVNDDKIRAVQEKTKTEVSPLNQKLSEAQKLAESTEMEMLKTHEAEMAKMKEMTRLLRSTITDLQSQRKKAEQQATDLIAAEERRQAEKQEQLQTSVILADGKIADIKHMMLRARAMFRRRANRMNKIARRALMKLSRKRAGKMAQRIQWLRKRLEKRKADAITWREKAQKTVNLKGLKSSTPSQPMDVIIKTADCDPSTDPNCKPLQTHKARINAA